MRLLVDDRFFSVRNTASAKFLGVSCFSRTVAVRLGCSVKEFLHVSRTKYDWLVQQDRRHAVRTVNTNYFAKKATSSYVQAAFSLYTTTLTTQHSWLFRRYLPCCKCRSLTAYNCRRFCQYSCSSKNKSEWVLSTRRVYVDSLLPLVTLRMWAVSVWLPNVSPTVPNPCRDLLGMRN